MRGFTQFLIIESECVSWGFGHSRRGKVVGGRIPCARQILRFVTKIYF